MKRFLLANLITLLFASVGYCSQATTSTTGENTTYAKVSVTSTTAVSLSAYSQSRNSVTCINADSSNAVYIGSSTAVSASGATAFPLFAKTSIAYANHTALYGIADAGVSSVNVYCIEER